MSSLRIVLAKGSLLLGAVAAATGAAELRPEALPGNGSSLRWEAPQFIQADSKGRVFLLRTDTLEVYPVERSGRLGEPDRLERAGTEGSAPLGAAMSPSGSEWIIWSGASTPVVLFRNGKRSGLPATGWQVGSVGLVRGEPVVGVLPVWVGRPPAGFRPPQPPPLVLSQQAGKWNPLITEGLRPEKEGEDLYGGYRFHRSSVLLGDREGKLWLAQQYAYRIRRYSAAGRLLLEIESRAPQQGHGDTKADQRLRGDLERQGMAMEKSRTVAFTAKTVIEAMAFGLDGRLYVLVARGAAGHALDRYDPVRGLVERLPFKLNDAERIASMAAGRDGLYFATYRGTDGRFRLSWDALEAADWQPAAGIEVHGAGLPAD